jgi:hypothetical protein
MNHLVNFLVDVIRFPNSITLPSLLLPLWLVVFLLPLLSAHRWTALLPFALNFLVGSFLDALGFPNSGNLPSLLPSLWLTILLLPLLSFRRWILWRKHGGEDANNPASINGRGSRPVLTDSLSSSGTTVTKSSTSGPSQTPVPSMDQQKAFHADQVVLAKQLMRVLFLVSPTLDEQHRLAQIKVARDTTVEEFFKQLKKKYARHRGWMACFSVWKYHHCDFYQVSASGLVACAC